MPTECLREWVSLWDLGTTIPRRRLPRGEQAIAHETYQCDGRAPADGSLFWGFPRLCGLGGVSNEFEFLPSDGSRGDNHLRLVRNDFVCERRVSVPSVGFVVHLRTSVGDLGTCLRWQSLPQTVPFRA